MSLSGVQKALSGFPPNACGNDIDEGDSITTPLSGFVED